MIAAAAMVSPASAKEVAVDYKPGQGLLFSAEGSEAEGRLSLWVQPIVGVAADEDGAVGLLEVRRARLDVVVAPKDWLRVELGIAADREKFRLRDAEGQVRLDDAFVIRAGRGRVPSGLERETSARDLALLERTSITDLVPGRAALIGVDGEHEALFWRTAVARVNPDSLPDGAPLAIDGTARVGFGGDHVGVSARGLVSPRPMGALGAELEDPSDGTRLAAARAWEGLGTSAGADFGVAVGRTRALVEGAILREGRDVSTISGHTLHFAGYGLMGVAFGSEHDRRGYDDAFTMPKGFEAVARLEGNATWPAPGAGDRTTGVGAALAASYAPTKSMRVQLEGRGGLSWRGDAAAQTGATVVAWLAVGP